METTRKIIEDLAQEYIQDKNNRHGFITSEWINRVTEALQLKTIDDLSLANMWVMVWLTLRNKYHYYSKSNPKLSINYLDVQSAFTEIVNIEARRRKEIS